MKSLVFVVHKHDATTLHYDLRLQIGSVMPSWAIPKGPTLDNTLKRLAIKTENHSLEYRHFEDVLPEGSYGAGTVMVWDEGTYFAETEGTKGIREAIKDPKKGNQIMQEGLNKGELKFFLNGKRLKGSFALVKTRGFGGPNAWLLIKHNDLYVKKGYDANDYDTSAVSGRSIKQIAKLHR